MINFILEGSELNRNWNKALKRLVNAVHLIRLLALGILRSALKEMGPRNCRGEGYPVEFELDKITICFLIFTQFLIRA